MPVSEKAAAAVLPPQGWLRRYVIHGVKQTTAPLIYHIGMGLSLLAVTCPTQYGLHYAGTLRSNQFVLLVGRSGEDRKSSALGVGKKILDEAAPSLIGDYPGSAEGLIDALAKRHTQLIPMSEFGKFLSQAQGGYMEQTKTLLADLWDSGPTQRSKANNKIVRVANPRLSIAAACSIPYLEKHTLSEDWTGGFMGRWLVLYGCRERIDPDPTGDMTDFQWLVDGLKARIMLPSQWPQGQSGWCVGMDRPATLYWNDWFNSVANRQLPHNIIGIRARAPTLARKVALLYGWDFGGALQGQPWRMGMDVLEPAIAFTELHIRSLIDLSEVIAEHPDARLRRSILMAIEASGGVATLGDILRIMKMRKRPILEMLDALMEEGRVQRVQTTQNGKYSYVARGVPKLT